MRILLEGLFNLSQYKLRSILALLGVMVGTASVVAMVLGGELATNEALKQFKSLGTDLLAVSTQNIPLQQATSLTQADQSILQAAPYTQLFQPLIYEGETVSGNVLGVTGDLSSLINIKLFSGRFVSLIDQYEQYAVVGHDVYQQMKKISFKEPLGQTIQIGKYIFTIVGVAEAWEENSFVYANIDESIMVPLLTSTMMSEFATINNVILKLSTNADIEKIETHLRHLLPDKQINFRNAKQLILKMEKQNNILTIFLGLIGGISLLVGGIGVMNIMLVSVVERKREIGIRLAVGATRFDIGALFLAEAVVLSLLGGLIGVMLGIAIAYIIACVAHWDFTLYIWPPLEGFSVSTAVGIFFGFYPAYQASKLEPMDALR